MSHGERGSEVCENRLTRKTFGLKRDKVAANWRKLHNAELHEFYSSPNVNPVLKCWRMTWAGHSTHMGGVRSTYRVLLGKPEGKRPFGKPKCRWG